MKKLDIDYDWIFGHVAWILYIVGIVWILFSCSGCSNITPDIRNLTHRTIFARYSLGTSTVQLNELQKVFKEKGLTIYQERKEYLEIKNIVATHIHYFCHKNRVFKVAIYLNQSKNIGFAHKLMQKIYGAGSKQTPNSEIYLWRNDVTEAGLLIDPSGEKAILMFYNRLLQIQFNKEFEEKQTIKYGV